MFGQTAEYLIFSDAELTPVPVLAERWEPNADGTVWTFSLNPAATYHDGSPVVADDVVATVRASRVAMPALPSKPMASTPQPSSHWTSTLSSSPSASPMQRSRSS